MGTKIASSLMPIWETPTTPVAMGADRPIEGITAEGKRMCSIMHVDPADWIKSARRRRAGGDALSETSLGRRVVNTGEDRATGPVLSGFRST